jgi:hypothetical protein
MTQSFAMSRYSTSRSQLDRLLSQSLMTLLLFVLLGRGLALTRATWAAWALAVTGGFAALAGWNQPWAKAQAPWQRNSWQRIGLLLLLIAACLPVAYQFSLAYPSLPAYQPGCLAATLVINGAVYMHRLLRVMPWFAAIALSTGLAWAGLGLGWMV